MNLRSLLLLIGALNGVLLVLLVLSGARNRLAGRCLAALIALVSLRLVPYVLGFAGAYDRWPALTFAPLDLSLAYGPLLWGYVAAIADGRLPPRWRLHLLPALLQSLYFTVCFALPLPAKWAWYSGPHLDWIEPAGLALVLISLGVYLGLAFARYRAYRSWLEAHYSPREEWRMDWLRHLLTAIALAWLAALAFAVYAWTLAPLDYFQRFSLMLVLCALVYALGLLGWRHGDRVHPCPPPRSAQPEPEPERSREPSTVGPAARVLAAQWAARVQAEGWWREDTLDLAELARRLHRSTRTVSRVLNAGLGENFNTFVNRLRVEAVKAALEDPAWPGDLLGTAFAAGFSAKASFNRAFKLHTGLTPSAYRAQVAARLESRQDRAAASSATTDGAV